MTTISWQLNFVVLDDILLDNCVSGFILQFRLFNCFRVEIALRDVTIVAWDMTCHFSSAHSEFVNFISQFCCIMRKFAARVVSLLAETAMIFSLKECSL